eukprot:TRINITY_DN10654_c0_g1_i1.p1 TRINITY_DN10654_c0_g1~~TRINITY_DN10654_c0_g1_i1.p1  ORF type:complete len:334 (+),score=38.14 TRINITY_DN10654_c0_g1_i1:12-1013(+)
MEWEGCLVSASHDQTDPIKITLQGMVSTMKSFEIDGDVLQQIIRRLHSGLRRMKFYNLLKIVGKFQRRLRDQDPKNLANSMLEAFKPPPLIGSKKKPFSFPIFCELASYRFWKCAICIQQALDPIVQTASLWGSMLVITEHFQRESMIVLATLSRIYLCALDVLGRIQDLMTNFQGELPVSYAANEWSMVSSYKESQGELPKIISFLPPSVVEARSKATGKNVFLDDTLELGKNSAKGLIATKVTSPAPPSAAKIKGKQQSTEMKLAYSSLERFLAAEIEDSDPEKKRKRSGSQLPSDPLVASLLPSTPIEKKKKKQKSSTPTSASEIDAIFG